MIAAVFGEPLWQVLFRHEHAAGIEVADVEHDQRAAIVVLGNVVDGGGAGKAVHDTEADRVLIKHRRKHAADGALLATRPRRGSGC